MINLPNLTVVMTDGAYNLLSRLALDSVLAHINPARILIYGPHNFGPPGAYHVPAQIQSEIDALRLLQYSVPRDLTTSHYFYLQWDSAVINPDLFDHAFLNYDYIGAPWPWHLFHDVGNGGFSIRSRRLAQAVSGFPFEPREDEYICRTHRGFLEAGFSIRFAPAPLAARFSVEHPMPNHPPSYGYHGLWNFAKFHSENDLLYRLNLLPSWFKKSRPDVQLLIQQCQQRDYKAALQMIERFK